MRITLYKDNVDSIDRHIDNGVNCRHYDIPQFLRIVTKVEFVAKANAIKKRKSDKYLSYCRRFYGSILGSISMRTFVYVMGERYDTPIIDMILFFFFKN